MALWESLSEAEREGELELTPEEAAALDRRWTEHVGSPEVVLRRYPATGARWQVSSGGGSWPRWSHDGDHVYYNTADGIYEVALTTSGDTVTLSRPRRLFARRAPLTEIGPDGFDVAKDGRFLVLERVASSTERFLHVVLNWTPRRAEGT
jgi:hypothetical protein